MVEGHRERGKIQEERETSHSLLALKPADPVRDQAHRIALLFPTRGLASLWFPGGYWNIHSLSLDLCHNAPYISVSYFSSLIKIWYILINIHIINSLILLCCIKIFKKIYMGPVLFQSVRKADKTSDSQERLLSLNYKVIGFLPLFCLSLFSELSAMWVITWVGIFPGSGQGILKGTIYII